MNALPDAPTLFHTDVPQQRELQVGSTFAGHLIRGVAGRGGMGVVYRAQHVARKHPVALKTIAAGRCTHESRTRFRREFESARSITHPNVVSVYEAGEAGDRMYVTMQLVDGTDLGQLLAREKRVEPRRAASLIAQVADGLDAVHAAGVVHRDVKPANVLIEERDGSERAVLSDFGVVKQLDEKTTLTRHGDILGTLDYTAPEQIEGAPVGPRTDVYALGCMLYQALTGSVPFARDTVAAKLFAHMAAHPPSVGRDVPAAFDEVIARAMAKDPAARYASAGEIGRAALAAAAS